MKRMFVDELGIREWVIPCFGLVIILAIGSLAVQPPPVHAQGSLPGVPWTCSLDNVGATLTRCIASANPPMRRYITAIVVQSTTATGGQFLLQTGTSTSVGGSANCGTATVSILPSSAAVARLGAPGNTAQPAMIGPFAFGALVVPTGKDLCVLGVATNTTTIDLFGFEAP